VLSEKKILNETKNHNPPSPLQDIKDRCLTQIKKMSKPGNFRVESGICKKKYLQTSIAGGRGGYDFLFRSEFFFRTTQELEYLFFLSRKIKYSQVVIKFLILCTVTV
jgi:hypothetical protein